MNLVSLLGFVTLLGLAWALSYHKREVKLRPIVWGLGLQLILATIILRDDIGSFIGMVALGLLVIVYMLRGNDGQTTKRVAIGIPALAAFGFLAVYLVPNYVGWATLVAMVIASMNSRLGYTKTQPYINASIVVLLISFAIATNTPGSAIFDQISRGVAKFLTLSSYGASFLFANFTNAQFNAPNPATGWPGFGFLFAFQVLPTIIFFGGFMSVCYYLGLVQKVIVSLSRFMRWTIGTSGAETLSCSANIFVGQTEAPLLIKPFLGGMTRSELLTIMVGGFATVAGGVLAGYIAMGVPAGHLLAAAVMSAPAALVVGKIIFPEREHSQTAGDVELPEVSVGGNVIEAATNGISDGLRLAVNVGAMLLGFIALVAVIDVILNFLDYLIDGRLLGGEITTYSSGGMSPIVSEHLGIFPGSLQTLFGTLLRPLAWLIGIPWDDAARVGNLLGVKLTLNEFVSYGTLGNYIQNDVISQRSIIISTYALCGFANFSSIGIQIGGLSSLAPERRSDLAKVGLRAMFGGAIASWLTATIAGMFLT